MACSNDCLRDCLSLKSRLFGGLFGAGSMDVKGLFGLCLTGFMTVFMTCLWLVLWADL